MMWWWKDGIEQKEADKVAENCILSRAQWIAQSIFNYKIFLTKSHILKKVSKISRYINNCKNYYNFLNLPLIKMKKGKKTKSKN